MFQSREYLRMCRSLEYLTRLIPCWHNTHHAILAQCPRSSADRVLASEASGAGSSPAGGTTFLFNVFLQEQLFK